MPKFGAVRYLGSHLSPITCVRITSDGARIYSASVDRTVREWDCESGSSRELTRISDAILYPRADPLPAHVSTFEIATGFLICGLHYGTVALVRNVDGEISATLPNPQQGTRHPFDFYTVAMHPSAPVLAASNGAYLNLWSNRGELLWSKTGFRGINAVRFLRGGKILMAHEWDPWIHLFDFESRERMDWESSLMNTGANWVTCCTAPLGSRFDFVISALDADGGSLLAINIDHPEPVWEMLTSDRVHSLCVIPGSEQVLTGGSDGLVELWDTRSDAAPDAVDLKPYAPADTRSRRRSVILTRPVVDDSNEDAYPPASVQSVDISAAGTRAAAGLMSGMVFQIEIV